MLGGAVQRHVVDGGVELEDDGLAVVLKEICYIIASDDYRRRQHIVSEFACLYIGVCQCLCICLDVTGPCVFVNKCV